MKKLFVLIGMLIFISCGDNGIATKNKYDEEVDYSKFPSIVDGIAYETRKSETDSTGYPTDVLFTGEYGGAEFKNGLLDGKVKIKDRLYILEYSFEKGKVEGNGYIKQRPNNNLIRKVEVKDGIGRVVDYYPSGELKREVGVKNHLLYGEEKIYWKDGSIKELNNYIDGKLVGERKTFYESGEKRFEGSYIGGSLAEGTGWFVNEQIALEKKDGIVRFYDYKGRMYRENDFNEMVMKRYNKKGRLIKEKPYLMATWNKAGEKKGKITVRYYHYNDLGLGNPMFLATWQNIEIEDISDFWETKAKIFFVDTYDYGYDELGFEIYESNDQMSMEYDGLGRKIRSMKNEWVAAAHYLSNETDYAYKSRYTYNEEDKWVEDYTEFYDEGKVTTIMQRVEFYDDDENLIYEKSGGREFRWYKYDEFGNMTQKNYLHREYNNWVYDEKGRVIKEYYKEFDYRNEGYEGMGDIINEYEYDELGRISKWVNYEYQYSKTIVDEARYAYTEDKKEIEKEEYTYKVINNFDETDIKIYEGEMENIYYEADKVNPFNQLELDLRRDYKFIHSKLSMKKLY